MLRLGLQFCRVFAMSCIAFAATGIAEAATVNTYSFTQSGYLPGATGPGTVSGTFAGQLNTLGQLRASDLSAFSMTISFPTDLGPLIRNLGGLGDLSLFSFNTDHTGDLLIAAQDRFSNTTCVGPAATLFAACNPGGFNSADALGVALQGGAVFAETTQAPVITLVSSVTDAPSAVAEPSTWAMMLSGFALLGGALRRSRGSPRMAVLGSL